MQRRRWITTLLIALVIAGGGLSAFGCQSQPEPQTTSEPEDRARRLRRVVSASGVVVPLQWAALSFSQGGKIEHLAVHVGDQVEAGTVLARLEATDLEQAVAQAKAALDTAQAALAQVNAGARPQEIASAQEEVAAAAANLAAAQAAQAQAQATLEGARAGEVAAQAARDQAQASLQGARAGEAAAQAALATADAEVKAAEVAIAAAEAELALVKAGASPQQRAIAKLEIDRARNSLWGAQAQRDALGGLEQKGYAKDADMNAVEAALGGAHVALNIAEVAYEEVEAGPRPEEIAPAQVQTSRVRAALAGTKAQVEAAQAQVDRARSEIALAEAQIKAAQAQLDRGTSDVALAEAQLAAAEAQAEATQARLGQAQAQLELTEAGPRPEDVALAQARVAEAEAALAAAESALADAQLLSPFAGTVARVELREGEVTSSGQAVLYLGDLAALQVETTDLNEVDIARVKAGQRVDITFDALAERTLAGRVESIEPISTPGQGGTNYTAIVSLEELDPELRWGMTAFVDIVVD